MDLWASYNASEDIRLYDASRELVHNTQSNDQSPLYKKEYEIQKYTHLIQNWLCKLDFDGNKFQEFTKEFPKPDADYCKSRLEQKISVLLKWHYYLALYFAERGDWIKKAIPLIVKSSRLVSDDLRAVNYLILAFNLNKLYGCNKEEMIKETAMCFIKHKHTNKFLWKYAMIIHDLEKSPEARKEVLDIVVKLSERQDYPTFERFLKSAIKIASDKKPIRDRLARRYENYGDEQTEPILKIPYYEKAQRYSQDNEDIERIIDKMKDASANIHFSSTTHTTPIHKLEIPGNNNVERTRFLVDVFEYLIPNISTS